MKRFRELKLWSNALFLIPLVYAYFYELYAYVLVLSAAIVLSVVFHLSNEKRYFWLDVFCSTGLMLSNLWLVIESKFALPYSILAILCVPASFVFYLWAYMPSKNPPKQYDFNHGLWHIFSALISFFCLAAYIMSLKI